MAIPPSEYRPPAQLSHTAAALSDRLPASQSVHSGAREPDERPAVHSSHAAWPVRLQLNLPLAHSEHEADEREAVCVPLGHAKHDEARDPL